MLFILLLLIIVLETNQNDVANISFFLLIGASILYYGIFNSFNFLIDNFSMVVLVFFGYTVVGVLWSFFKWDRFCLSQFKKWENMGQPRVSKELYKPKYTNNKSKLFSWTFIWPISIIGYIIGDLLVDFFNFILKYFGEIYNKISNRHFGV